ncbi:MAG: peptidoglycan-binding protein, partial [Proteobacteria bacterium]|nr:peptidoglycan-binding protein [Pseudomonadota bacterium]
MQTVRQIAEEIVAREGGFVNDPDDPGGATNHGVTIHTMRRLGLDLDGDGVVGVADVRALTRAQAIDIFIRHYYERPGIAVLPAVLQASVFD